MEQVFAPGCALMIYKPHIAQNVLDFLNKHEKKMAEHLICCRHQPNLPQGVEIINVCAGCDKRYRSLYQGITTISLWEVLANSDSFQFPDYHGAKMAIQDACPTRGETRVHQAVRRLLDNMNIRVIEPELTRGSAVCCGDSFYGTISIDQLKTKMKDRGRQMPCDDVAVYCVSCIKSMHIAGKKPRYLLDLLFGEPTTPGTFEPELWHNELNKFIDDH